jgi:hypothetical protein
MSSDLPRRHVFISHHHKDDEEVTKLTELLKGSGYDIRNSSIRAKPANQQRLEQGLVSEVVIKRLLRMKISWAGTVLVLIGEDTHERPWVNWEIEEANRQGKRIVGVFVRGGGQANVPEAFERYGTGLVKWTVEGIIGAIDGTGNVFQQPDGSIRPMPDHSTRTRC